MENWVVIIVIVIFLLIIVLFLIRAFSERQLDDVSPGIPCSQYLIEKSDVLFIIPKYNNISLTENKSWCENIKKIGKKLALHGVNHEENEFLTDKDDKYLEEGISIFEQCFGKKPERFKPPYLKISKNNTKLVKSKMKLDLNFNQLTHKIYHCNDRGLLPNWVQNLI